MKPITKYGVDWDPQIWSPLQIELHCYERNHSVEAGGLGAHGHLRNAMQMIWPDTYAGEQEPGIPRWRPEIDRMVWAWCNYPIVVVLGHASAGKSLAKGTKVMLYDGSVVPVEDVKPGMLLMGDDSTPRKVLGVHSGTENMYRIRPSYGEPWVCNESHILSLKAAYVPRKNHDFVRGDVRDVPLTEFLTYGETKRRVWKQYRVGVEFPPHLDELEVDPYIFGAWLGDGDTVRPCLTHLPGPVSDRWVDYWSARGYKVVEICRTPESKCRSYNVTNGTPNTARRFLRSTLVDGKKRIPHRYLTASREERMQLLAGIIDTDGYVDKNSFSVTTKLTGLADDYVFLARSLGFAATRTPHVAKIKARGYECEVYNIHISGPCDLVPTLLKRCSPRASNRDPLLQEITVEPLGLGEYYGVELDGNARYLLGDFTVTHNTHTFARIGFASFIADWQNTILTLTSTHLPGLRKRIWADLVSAIRTNKAGADFSIRNFDLTARPAVVPKEDKYIIEGISTDRGEDAVSKIQGNHSRKHRHLIVDEADGTPGAVLDATANLMTDQDFRIALLANPAKKFNELGNWAEPVGGWASLDPEIDFEWETKKGGICLRLDGMRSTNVVHQRTIFPYLIDQRYIDSVVQSHGVNSPKYWTFVRAWYPPDGAMGTVLPPTVLERGDEPLQFNFRPTPCASFDPAFEGGDESILTIGEYGPVGDAPFNLNLVEQVPVKVSVSKGSDPLDFLIAREVMKICKDRGVEPRNFAMDITGNARGVYAILQREWSTEVEGVSFGGSATNRPVRYGDSTPAKDIYDRFVTELWFSAREFIMDRRVGGLSGHNVLKEQLAAREYEMASERKSKLESKRDFHDRLGYSPDRADSLVVMIELLRRKGAVAGRAEDFQGPTHNQRLLDRAKKYSKLETMAMAGA